MADALTRRFQTAMTRIGERAGKLTAREWAALGNWDEADLETFARTVGPTLDATKNAAVQTGRAYYAVRANLLRPPNITPAMIDITPNLRDPFIAYWRALKMGRPIEEAILSGTSRASAFAVDFATSAGRLTGGALYRAAGVNPTYWVRTPDANACDWCNDVAGNEFPSESAADIGHTTCHCSIDPVF